MAGLFLTPTLILSATDALPVGRAMGVPAASAQCVRGRRDGHKRDGNNPGSQQQGE
jgi:hypothetical protein